MGENSEHALLVVAAALARILLPLPTPCSRPSVYARATAALRCMCCLDAAAGDGGGDGGGLRTPRGVEGPRAEDPINPTPHWRQGAAASTKPIHASTTVTTASGQVVVNVGRRTTAAVGITAAAAP